MSCYAIKRRIERTQDELEDVEIRFEQNPTDDYLQERIYELEDRLDKLQDELDECEFIEEDDGEIA